MSPPPLEIKKHKLTVFLIKEGYDEIEDFLSIKGFERVDVVEDGKWQGALIYKGGFQSTPSWVSIFDELPGFDATTIKNQSSKALYVLKCEERWFCYTFGYARHLIDEHAYERNFGLIVTLNLSDTDAVKSIDKANISHISLHSREQTTKAIELGSFEFDNDIDLLKSITAKSHVSGTEEPETLSGRDSVSIHTRALVEDFHEIASRLFEAFTDTKYMELYPWIDKITEERDKSVVENLDTILASRIVNRELEKIWLAVPDIVEWEELKGFAYKHRQEQATSNGPVTYQDLDIHEWSNVANIPDELSAEQLKHKKIHVYWQDERHTTWSVYRCLNAEADLDGKKYILNDSAWYHIQSDFVSDVTNFFDSVPDAVFSLPPFGEKNEPAYLIQVTDDDTQYALMDRKLIQIGNGRSKVEFCDLYSLNGDIIHVKRYGGSSVLSHLFSQAVVSAECFLHEEDFRQQVNEHLPDTHKLGDPTPRPSASEFIVCIAVMSKEAGALELPFFSKVSFKHAVKSLQNLDYKVCKLKIEKYGLEETD